MRRPVVGVIGNSYLIDDQYPVQASGVMNIQALSEVCDAIGLIIPCLPGNLSTKELIDFFDGFLFTGGRPNVHPSEYGQDATEAHGSFDQNRDSLVLPLIRECQKLGKPILGICRGFQEFNVAFSGTLHPEIRELPGRINHRMPPDGTLEEKFAQRHKVVLKEGGAFAKIFDAKEVLVNSLHGQGIDIPGKNIHIEGWASDGTIEAISLKNSVGFALAVQWHPEWNAKDDIVSKQLFQAFGEALESHVTSNIMV